MAEFREGFNRIELREDEKVFLNQGTLRVLLVAKSRDENRVLLESLFKHLSEWFTENIEHLGGEPILEGSTYEVALEDPAVMPFGKPPTEIDDTFPEEWLQ